MTGGGKAPGSAGEVLFEFRSIGQQVRVAAIDPQTGTEVVILAPRNASRSDMQRIASAKLRRRLAASADDRGDGLDSGFRV